jgi:uncharacterized protein
MVNVDQKILDEIIRRIVETVRPDKIVMFGSRARGEATETSDLDLLVVADSDKPMLERSGQIYCALRDISLPTDILVYTQSEIDDWSLVRQHVVTTAIREGKIVYEKAH